MIFVMLQYLRNNEFNKQRLLGDDIVMLQYLRNNEFNKQRLLLPVVIIYII